MSLVIKFEPGLRPVIKHQEHEQASHGNWANSGSPKLTIMGKNDGLNEFFNEQTRVVRYQPEGKEPTDYVLFIDGLYGDTVYASKKPTDGTTIDGSSGAIKRAVGHLDITRGANPWRSSAKNDNKSTIVEVAVKKAHQRRGLASAMLRFHRDMFPEQDLQHSDALLPDGQAWADVAKHQEHNQKTHGNWASGNYENLADWFKDEVKVFESETDKEVYFMQKLFSQRLKGFTEMAHPEFSGAISFYQGAGGYHLNEALRDPQISKDAYQKTIDSLDKAIEIAPPLSEELVAYRGVKGNGLNFFEKLKVGDIFEDKGYVSTTIDAGVAQQFGGSQPYYDGLVFRMKLPAGTKGIFPSGYHEPMYGWTPSMTEAEFLMPRNSKFTIVAQRGKVWDIEYKP